jgi:hypothetical protein
MMISCGILGRGLLLVLLTAAVARGQFLITGSTPVDGSANQPDDLQICLTFSADLDTTQRFPFNGHDSIRLPVGVLVAEPENGIVPPPWQWHGDTRTLCLSLSVTDNEDYYFLFSQARDTQGRPLETPFELHLSTRPTFGTLLVAGTVAREDGGSLEGIVVALFEGHPLSLEESWLRAATVVTETSGAFTIPFVRPGTYHPVAMLDADGDGNLDPESGDFFGVLDVDQDHRPDPLVVTESQTGLHLQPAPLPMPTAREFRDSALDLAHAVFQADDAELRLITSAGATIHDDGGCLGWTYQFTSEALQVFIQVAYMGGMAQVDSFHGTWGDSPTLPADFVDSDLAIATTLANGGEAVEASLEAPTRYAFVGNFPQLWWPDPQRILWFVHIGGWGESGWADYLYFIDALTGQFLGGYQTGLPPRPPARPVTPSLGEPWPNPFNPSLHIPFELGRAQDVRLAVYNLGGQLVAEPAQGPQAAGRHEVLFDGAALGSGLYLVVLEAEGLRETRKIALMK